MGVFARKLFIQIHSEMRLLCMTDAFLGAVVGFFAGSVLLGAISGGLLGLLNYEIVSIRILKLNPRKIKD